MTHERNPLCIKDMNHLIEIIEMRFDSSDKNQNEIKEQVKLTNGRTRKLEDAHIEQIELNKELLNFIIAQKQKNSQIMLISWVGKNWKELLASSLVIIGIYTSIYISKML
jgi:hypothetical protein